MTDGMNAGNDKENNIKKKKENSNSLNKGISTGKKKYNIVSKNFLYRQGIRLVLLLYSLLVTNASVGATIFFVSKRMAEASQKEVNEGNMNVLNQAGSLFDIYLRDVMKLSNTIYYNVFKNSDENVDIHNMLNLLYDSYRGKIENIAIFSLDGNLMYAAPAARMKTGYDVKDQEWFTNTFKDTENNHFSLPHLQQIFESGDYRYKWVVSMSRIIELTRDGKSEQAVLLIDMKYDELVGNLSDISFGSKGYVYMIDNKGEVIWHPKMGLLYSGRLFEYNAEAAQCSDGVHKYKDKSGRILYVKTIGYTGWRIAGVGYSVESIFNSPYTGPFISVIIFAEFFAIALIYTFMFDKISDPISRLQEAVQTIEEGDFNQKVPVGGVYEIESLGKAVENMRIRINQLIEDKRIENQKRVEAEEMRVQAEFDVLQAQINPHFLYNTLSIVIWLIEAGKTEDAKKVVTAVGNFFRIFLSTDRKFIPVSEEIDYVKNYILIQQMRFKDKFVYEFDIDENVNQMSTLKLILQPIVENSIYHGMEYMDDEDGRILIKAYIKDDKVYFSVKDNGAGMTKERIAEIMSADMTRVSKPRGSGIGFKNVRNRILKQYGSEGGVEVISEPDEGTEIIIYFPAEIYTKKDVGA